MNILLSGFEPFGEETVNPTALLMQKVQSGAVKFPPALHVSTVILPVIYVDAFPHLLQAALVAKPDVILSFGLNSGRTGNVELERVAINCQASEMADNTGATTLGRRIDPLDADAYFTSLPLEKFSAALKARNVPVVISNTAGTYVCNTLFYQLQQWTRRSLIRSGFVHLPLLPEQAKKWSQVRGREFGSMSLEMMVLALVTMTETLG